MTRDDRNDRPDFGSDEDESWTDDGSLDSEGEDRSTMDLSGDGEEPAGKDSGSSDSDFRDDDMGGTVQIPAGGIAPASDDPEEENFDSSEDVFGTVQMDGGVRSEGASDEFDADEEGMRTLQMPSGGTASLEEELQGGGDSDDGLATLQMDMGGGLPGHDSVDEFGASDESMGTVQMDGGVIPEASGAFGADDEEGMRTLQMDSSAAPRGFGGDDEPSNDSQRTVQMDGGEGFLASDSGEFGSDEGALGTMQVDGGRGAAESGGDDDGGMATFVMPPGGAAAGPPDAEQNDGRTLNAEDFGGEGGEGQTYVAADAGDGGIEQTFVASDLPVEQQQMMQDAWGGPSEFDAVAGGGMTIKGAERLSGIPKRLGPQETLVIKSRQLAETNSPQIEDAEYELIDKLGEGGMGIVWHARQTSINRAVAIKMLKPKTVDNEEQRQKFLAEAVVTGDLDHPNIVPIYDVGTYRVPQSKKGALFYSMKKVQGTPWLDAIKKKTLTENIEILMNVSDAVAFAHDRGIVHRDLKPENIMLGSFGEVLVMDWGLAQPTKKFNKSASITQTISMGGTPAYMAPEMATGPIDKIGPHSDIYLLGAILYEVVTGKPPHTGKNAMKCLMAAAKNEIVPTERTGELVDIALKAMATNPKARYESVKAFQAAIREYQEHSESIVLSTRAEDDLKRARTTNKYEDFQRAVFGFEEAYALWGANPRAKGGVGEARYAYAGSALGRGDFDLAAGLLDAVNPDHTVLLNQVREAKAEVEARQHKIKVQKRILRGAILVLFVVVGGATAWINAERTEAVAQRDRAREQEGIATAARDEAEAQRKIADEQRVEATEQRDKAEAQRLLAEKARADELQQRLAAEMAKAEEEKQRKTAVVAQMKAEEEEKKAKEAEMVAVVERDKARAAKEAEEYEAYIARIGLAAAKIGENAFDAAFVLLRQCEPKEAGERDLRNWEWGRLMHLCTQSSQTYDSDSPNDSVAISTDGKRFVSGGWNGEARIWDVETGEVLHVLPHGGLYVYSVAISPDGQSVATGSNDSKGFVKIWNAETGELVKSLEGHTDAALSVAYSRDGRRLLTSSYDRSARLWDIATGRELRAYVGHNWWVWDAAFSPDEKRIVTASQDGTAAVWNTDTGEKGAPFTGHEGPVYSAVFSPDGRYVVTAGYDKRILKWKPEDVKPYDFQRLAAGAAVDPPKYQAFVGHTGAVRSVSFSRDGLLVLSGSHDNSVKVWQAETGEAVKTFRGHNSWVRSAAFSEDGRWVLSGSHDNKIKRWSIADYEEIRVLRGRVLTGHADAVLAAAFSPDGLTIVTASRDRSAKTWDLSTGAEKQSFAEGHSFLASASQFFPDGKKLLTAAVDNTTRVWDVSSGTELARLERTGRSAAVTLSHDGRWILTGSDDKSAKVWDAKTGELVRTLTGHRSEVTAVAFSADGKLACTGDSRGKCRLWEVATGTQLRELDGHTRRVVAVAFHPNGERVLTASGDNTVGQWDVQTGRELTTLVLKHPDGVMAMALNRDGSRVYTNAGDQLLREWNLETAKLEKSFTLGAGSVNSISVSADGGRLLTANADTRQVQIWETETGREIKIPAGQGQVGPFIDFSVRGGLVWAATFSPGDDYVLTVGGSDARMWDVQTAEERMSFSPHGIVASASFSPEGKRIVTGSWDNSAKVWNAETGQALLKLEGEHSSYVNSAVFSPDAAGKWILTASDDNTVKLWDSQTGKVIRTFTGHTGGVKRAVFSNNGNRILTSSADKTARIWDVETGKSLQTLGGDQGHKWAVTSAAFSTDGTKVITGSDDNDAKIWNAETGELIMTLSGHTAAVTSVAFSPDGKRVMTGSQDDTVKLWDSVPSSEGTAKEILTLSGHTQEVTSVAFSADGQFALTGSRDGTAIVWLATDWRENGKPAVAEAQR